MKANELSVGDWVCATLRGLIDKERLTPPMRVTAIGEAWVQLLVDPKSGYPDKYVIDDIRPIPLTGDILLDNGWLQSNPCIYRWEVKTNEGLSLADVEVNFLEGGLPYIRVWAPRHTLTLYAPYVHTLQHSMRLAGIEKEIKL